jgi:Leucine-rich repeat (LRR) protein
MCRKTQLLNLSDNKITDITGLEKMVEIKELILKGNRLRQPDLRKFINLERLNVSDNDMQNFELKLLPPCLLELDIGDNKI